MNSVKNIFLKQNHVLLNFWRGLYIADVIEWSRALDIRLSDWCCSVSMVWVQIPSREEHKFDSSKSNSNTVWFNFQTYIIYIINLVSLVTLRSSGTDILYGCHLLLDVCIMYFISCDCIMNSSLSYTIYKKLLRLLSNYNIKYICTIYTRLYKCLMYISRFSLRDKVTLRSLKLHFLMERMWSSGLGRWT
jgi:hypothetical protein